MIKLKSQFLILIAIVVPTQAHASGLQVSVFSAKVANVNSFVFYDSVGSLIVDTTRNSKDATEVAKLARAHGTGPQIIFVTHGHPDHYLGMSALKREFPQARILVASQLVKDDIISFAAIATQGHWLDDEPLMKPKSEKNPDGFDYEREIHVLKGNTLVLPGGEKIEVISNFPATEAAHETVLFSKDLNSLFVSDLAYNGVHLWLGRGVDEKSMDNWQTELKKLSEYYVPLKSKVYPGHGKLADTGIFDIDLKYIKDFKAAVQKAKTEEDARAEMMKRYPSWEGADFSLRQSVKNSFGFLNENKINHK